MSFHPKVKRFSNQQQEEIAGVRLPRTKQILIMTIKCCVQTCKNTYKSKGRKVEDEINVACLMFHYFPKNKERKAMWINNIRKINGSTWKPKDSSFVCSEHFDSSSWELIREDGKRKLKIIAVPSVFNDNRTSKLVINDHMYAVQMPLQDIINKNDIAQSSVKKKKLRSSCNNDHMYTRQPICSNNQNASKIASSVGKTTSTDNGKSGADTLETETNSAINKMYNSSEKSELDVLIQCLEREEFLNVCASTVKSVEDTSAIISLKIQQENMNNSDVLVQDVENKEKFVYSHTATRSDSLDTLYDCAVEVKNDIATQTVAEQNIGKILEITTLTKENEQLKKHLAELKKTVNKVLGQNEVLRRSNKNMYKQLNIWKNIKKKEEEGMLKTFNEDQKKVLCRKNSQGVKWESVTLKQALKLRLKCGSSGYEEMRKQFPLPSLRTLQRRTKHIEFGPGILKEAFDLLASEIPNHKEEWKDCVLALDEMSITSGEVIDPSTN